MSVSARGVLASVVLAGILPVAGSALGPCSSASRAAGTHRAALVVEMGNGAAREFCVSFTEPTITGLELLRRSGLAVSYQDYGGGAVIVCRVAGTGCPYPEKPCFCHCVTADRTCTFWGYYRIDRTTGAWRFASQGAGTTQVRDGDVDGWRWGKHGVNGTDAPAAATPAQICARARQVDVVALRVRPPVGARTRWWTAAAFLALVFGLLAWAAIVTRARRGSDD